VSATSEPAALRVLLDHRDSGAHAGARAHARGGVRKDDNEPHADDAPADDDALRADTAPHADNAPGADHAPHADDAPDAVRPAHRAEIGAAALVGSLRLWKRGRPRDGTSRPWLALNMASTADGRATIGGRSGPIGNRADGELFHALRTAVDAVLVGAGTVRAEHYGRLVREESARALRRARGLAEEPLGCIVSQSLALPADEIPLLAEPGARVAILTPSSAGLPESAAEVRYVRCSRDGRLDLRGALEELYGLGVRTMLCEGGPHLNAQLLAAGVVDELFLSVAPKLASGDASGESLRIVSGAELEPPVELELLGALESESLLLLRYGLAAGAP
jgi:riboflavin biosynthesis pyrimidine reductase